MPNPPNSTNTLQRAVNIAQNFVRNSPLTFSGTNDPAFMIGDWVRQFMLAPPFAWRWNRATTTFLTIAGQQDYEEEIPQFGWLEVASITDNTGTTALTYEQEIVLDLSEESTQNQPARIAARLDDGNGNITFRLSPPPDKIYTVTLTYQLASSIFQNLSDTWAPVPDYFSYLYNQGMLAKSYEYVNDPRANGAITLFVRQVIAANAGLDDSQINIFLQDRIDTQRQLAGQLANSQIGRQGRGAL